MGRNTGRGKVAYSWISPDPAKAGPTLGVVVVVVVRIYFGGGKGGNSRQYHGSMEPRTKGFGHKRFPHKD